MLFGNWNVTDVGIAWNSPGLDHFTIPRQGLLATWTNPLGGAVYYQWILRATDQDWLSTDDLYDLNYAFVYAAARYGLDFDYDIFDATLEEQFERLDEEEEDEEF